MKRTSIETRHLADSNALVRSVEDLFVGDIVLEVPSSDDRYRYKKVGGSSDTRHTADEFE